MEFRQPIIPNPLRNGDRGGSLRRQTGSRRSSVSGKSSKASMSFIEDTSEQAKPSKRGKKPFELPEEVDRGIVRILDSTPVSFDKLAQAVEESGGPRKLWLRRRLERITDTKCFGALRLRNHREGSEARRQAQRKAMGLRELHSPNHSRSEMQDLETHLSIPVPSEAVLQRAQARPILQRDTSTNDGIVMQSEKRRSGLSLPPAIEEAGQKSHPPRVRSSAASPLVRRDSYTTPNVIKRTSTNGSTYASRTSYGARKARTRALSLSDITQRLEVLTGQTGLYDHIKRISVKSHISPGLQTFRFSWRSRRTSEGSTAPRTSILDLGSPEDNEVAPARYYPDPDYETFYHDPTPDMIAQLNANGAFVLASLLSAKAASLSDEDAESHLLEAMSNDPGAELSDVDATDNEGITALHLAASYGYPRVCRYLMQNGSNPSAMTNRGSSVCRFARAAQDLAGDTAQYHRILNCRQWICAGLPPPVVAEEDAQDSSDHPESKHFRRSRKRARTDETGSGLFTVEETPREEASPSITQMSPRYSNCSDRYSGLAPLITGFEFPLSGQRAEQAMSVYSNSPLSTRNCPRDHNDIARLLTPSSFSPDEFFWPVDATVPASGMDLASASIPQPSHTADITTYHYNSFDGLKILADFGAPARVEPSSSYLTQYDSTFPGASTARFDSMGTTVFDWPATNLKESEQTVHFQDATAPTFDYNHQLSVPVSRPQLPTPPSNTHPRQQEPQRPDWDVSNATAQALSHQDCFPNRYWLDNDQTTPADFERGRLPEEAPRNTINTGRQISNAFFLNDHLPHSLHPFERFPNV